MNYMVLSIEEANKRHGYNQQLEFPVRKSLTAKPLAHKPVCEPFTAYWLWSNLL